MIVFYVACVGTILTIGTIKSSDQKEQEYTYLEKERQNKGSAVIVPSATSTPAPAAAAPTPAATTTTKSTTTPSPAPVVPAKTTLTPTEVKKHSSNSDCWIILSNVVYNITPYINNHTGGTGHIQCGADQTTAIGDAHGSKFNSYFSSYKVGNIGSQI